MLSVWRLCAGPDSEHRRSEHLEMFAGVFRTGEADGVIAGFNLPDRLRSHHLYLLTFIQALLRRSFVVRLEG